MRPEAQVPRPLHPLQAGLGLASLGCVPESASYDLYYRGRDIWEHGDVREAVPLLEHDVHSALKFLERAANERDSDVISVRWDPVCEHLRHEEAYQRVLKTIGM